MSRQVHVILLDIELPRGDGARKEARAGIQAIPEFLHEAPGAEIIMFSQHDHAELGMEALRRGATDFVVKPTCQSSWSAPSSARSSASATGARSNSCARSFTI